MKAHPMNKDIILSVSKDATIRLWDMSQGECLAVYKSDATTAVSDWS